MFDGVLLAPSLANLSATSLGKIPKCMQMFWDVRRDVCCDSL